MLLLLLFLFDHSEIFTGETRHIVPPYNKAGISNFFLLRISEIAEITDFFKMLLLLQFLFNHSEIFTGETRHIVPPLGPITKAEFQISACNSRNCRNIAEITDFFQTLLLLQFLFNHSEIFTGETSHIVSPCNKARISNFCLEFQKLQKLQISLKCYSSFSSYSIILKFLLEKLGI